MNIIDYFDQGWRIDPDKVCLKFEGDVFTYDQLRNDSLRLANAFYSQGLERGFHGAVLCSNKPMGLVSVLGLLRAGATWSPVNPRNAAPENSRFLNTIECEALIYHSDFEEQVDHIRGECKTITRFICIDKPLNGDPCLEEWLEHYPTDAVTLPFQPERIAALPGTGGTTGHPKGVCITNRVFQTYMGNMFACMNFHRDSVYLAAAPVSHAAGVLVYPIFAKGGTVVMQDGINPQKVLAAIGEEKVTMVYLPPTAIYALLSQPNISDFDYSSLENFVCTASPISKDKLREASEVFGPVMTQTYSQTECMLIVSFMGPEDYFDETGEPHDEGRLASCGRPAPFVSAAVMDAGGNLLGAGERGEVVVQSDMVMAGYYNNPEATAEAIRHGWLHTGDIGQFDEDGYLYIVDRAKDMIISGGFNIYPIEIEQVLWSHPAVQDCAVIGVPDDKWGEAVKAIVLLKSGFSATEEELMAVCKAKLGSVKTPKSIDFVADLPRSGAGKVLKRTLREQYWEGATRAI